MNSSFSSSVQISFQTSIKNKPGKDSREITMNSFNKPNVKGVKAGKGHLMNINLDFEDYANNTQQSLSKRVEVFQKTAQF